MKTFKHYIKEDMDKKHHDEMYDWFNKRTRNHIRLVQKYAKKIEDFNSEKFKGLRQKTENHDESKFHDPEMQPYLHIAWQYHMKDLGKEYNPPEDIQDKMNQATEHHCLHNDHHPEKWE